MSDSLATYLQDHLAGADFAVDLLQSLREQHGAEPLGQFASSLLVDIEEDRTVLKAITDRIGREPSNLKEAAAWMTEKLSRWKLGRDVAGGLGTFEALETLG